MATAEERLKAVVASREVTSRKTAGTTHVQDILADLLRPTKGTKRRTYPIFQRHDGAIEEMAEKHGITKSHVVRIILDDFFSKNAHLFETRAPIANLQGIARLRGEPTVERSFVIFDEHTILLEALAKMYGLNLYDIFRLAIDEYFSSND